MLELLNEQFNQSRKVAEAFFSHDNLALIARGANLLADCFRSSGKVITCGNGGSMCDAMHLAEELSGKYRKSRPPLPAFSISDPGYLTCAANDFGFDFVFSRYVKAFLMPRDLLVAFSTSGNSSNVVNAAMTAKELGVTVVALTGNDGGKLKDFADLEIRVPHFGYADRIQEVHIQVVHALIMGVESILFPELYTIQDA